MAQFVKYDAHEVESIRGSYPVGLKIPVGKIAIEVCGYMWISSAQVRSFKCICQRDWVPRSGLRSRGKISQEGLRTSAAENPWILYRGPMRIHPDRDPARQRHGPHINCRLECRLRLV